MDFTLDKYEQLLQAIQDADTTVYGIKNWIRNAPERGIILRHDVDRLPHNALQMAQLEAEYNIQSTYYFRIGNHTFKPKIILAIYDLGHEIGYHYEDLSLAKGDINKALQLFENHLEKLHNIVPVETIAMHGRPLSPFDNRDLWKDANFSTYGITGEAFLSINYQDKYYFTDTGRSWGAESLNLRDNVKSNKMEPIKGTDQLADFIKKEGADKNIAIVAHPERWNSTILKWVGYYLFDLVVLVIKSILKIIR